MFMRLPLLLIAATTSSSLVACVGAAPEATGTEPATSTTATAIIALERTSGPGDATRGDAIIARFVRVRQGAVDDPALRMAGVAEDIPTPGTCVAPSDATPVIQGRSVELLDVGPVVLTSDSTKSTMLLPRSMPDPAGVVSGVIYSSRSADVFSSGSPVSLRSAGGQDLADGFFVSVTAPRDLTDVHVTSLPSGLDVSWDASDADPHDVVYVDVLSPAPRIVMRCTGMDAGHLLVPQSSIAGFDEGQLAVHRLHKESFKAKGLEPGEVRFDVAKIVTFHR